MGVVSTGSRSAELSQETLTFVDGSAKIRPLKDHIVIEPLDAEPPSSIIWMVEKTKPLRGIVKAVGPGHYPKRYDHPDKHQRSKMWDSKHFQPTEVKVGDVVELGGAEHGGYSFPKILWGGKPHILCREADVAGICFT